MGTVLLVIHLLVAIFLVAVILLQRSEGGALDGLGGGNGASSFLSARGTGNFLTRTTAILATIFIITSISLSLYYKGHRPSCQINFGRSSRCCRSGTFGSSGSGRWQVDEALKRK